MTPGVEGPTGRASAEKNWRCGEERLPLEYMLDRRWFAMAWHLDRLIEEEPAQARWFRMRDRPREPGRLEDGGGRPHEGNRTLGGRLDDLVGPRPRAMAPQG